jgi:glutamate synthase (NADPH/NADH) small chain
MKTDPEPGDAGNSALQGGWPGKYAWREVDRVDPPRREIQRRVGDFRGAVLPYDETTARMQASRCVVCPHPNCVEVCPLETPIADLLALIADGQFREAAELFFARSSLPELASHVCFGGRRCETVCVLGHRSDPVPIRSITRFLLDYGWRHGLAEPPVAAPTTKRVAVIGSGICGLVSADLISRRGHHVTVFDSRQKPGGRMVNGLPGFRVDKELVERRVELLRQRGIQFRMGITCGRELSLDELRRDYDAVLLAFGRAEPVPLKIPGADLSGVHSAHAFVTRNSSGGKADLPRIDVRGRSVVVLGGGDTAMDALRTAIRCGAREATCVYRRDEANLAADGEEYAYAAEEGAKFVFLSQAVELIGNAEGCVSHVRCVRMQLDELDGAGRFGVKPVDGAEFYIPAETVLVAYGFKAPGLPRDGGFAELKTDLRGCLVVADDQQTNLPGVFAGGSVVRGVVPLAEVVRDAIRAAQAIEVHLSNGPRYKKG